MKINIGSGFKRYDGFLNIDDDPLVNPDYLLNIETDPLPFEDNSVDEIRAYHIMEHIGEGFIPFMKELYRVCKNDALLDIIVPHHLHDSFWGDPTHRRPITVNVMYHFSKKWCLQQQETWGSSNGMAGKYNIDFDMEHYEFVPDSFYNELIDSIHKKRNEGKLTHDENFMFERLMREATNVMITTKIKMRAVK